MKLRELYELIDKSDLDGINPLWLDSPPRIDNRIQIKERRSFRAAPLNENLAASIWNDIEQRDGRVAWCTKTAFQSLWDLAQKYPDRIFFEHGFYLKMTPEEYVIFKTSGGVGDLDNIRHKGSVYALCCHNTPDRSVRKWVKFLELVCG